MWPFRKNRQSNPGSLAGAYASVLSDAVVAKLRENPSAPRGVVAVSLHFLVIQLRDDRLESIPKLLARVFDIACEHQCVVDGVMSSYVTAYVMPIEDDGEAAARSLSLTSHLLSDLRESVKVAYGKKDCLQGVVGSHQIFRYGFFLENFSEIVCQLSKLRFGNSVELQ